MIYFSFRNSIKNKLLLYITEKLVIFIINIHIPRKHPAVRTFRFRLFYVSGIFEKQIKASKCNILNCKQELPSAKHLTVLVGTIFIIYRVL